MRVAVVGSGVSGLAATWLLNEYSDHEVHLYEADSRTGGHANTVTFSKPGAGAGAETVEVDTGFIVFNPTTYPNFLRFLGLYPSIQILPTEMTFSVSRDGGAFEWAGDNLRTIFCQAKRLLDPEMWTLIYDVLRFNANCRRLIASWQKSGDLTQGNEFSIGEYLDKNGFSASFKDNYLIPMTAAIWSTPPDKCAMDFPARTLIQFMHNHHLLQITGKPKWLTLHGGSRRYVNAILDKLPTQQLHLSCAIKSLSTEEHASQVQLERADGKTELFDHVILACHSDTALNILRNGKGLTKSEERILGAFDWNENHVVLHADPALMPRSRLAWSCWNYLTYSEVDEKGQTKANVDRVSLTYGMNDLQHIPEKTFGPVLVTLNPPFPPDPSKTLGSSDYTHPVLDHKAIRAQRLVPEIQGRRGISYAGAYLNFGFHEDGFTSGLLAATKYAPVLNGKGRSPRMPFEMEFMSGSSWADDDSVGGTRSPGLGIGEWAVKLLALAFDGFEGTGARLLVGFVLGRCLGVVGAVLHLLCGFQL